jgi:cytochrome c-type biogenesis protein CcmE
MKPKIVIGVIIIIGALSLLIVRGLNKTAFYYYTISELRGKKDLPSGQGFRISGTIVPQSIQWNAEAIQLNFILVEGTDSLQVRYNGTMPDRLADAQQIVVEGLMETCGVFTAKKILIKCPSKYESKNN